MIRTILFAFLLLMFLAACAPTAPVQETAVREGAPEVIVYRAPT